MDPLIKKWRARTDKKQAKAWTLLESWIPKQEKWLKMLSVKGKLQHVVVALPEAALMTKWATTATKPMLHRKMRWTIPLRTSSRKISVKQWRIKTRFKRASWALSHHWQILIMLLKTKVKRVRIRGTREPILTIRPTWWVKTKALKGLSWTLRTRPCMAILRTRRCPSLRTFSRNSLNSKTMSQAWTRQSRRASSGQASWSHSHIRPWTKPRTVEANPGPSAEMPRL